MKTTPLQAWIALKIGLPAEPLTRQAITAYQAGRLRNTLEYAKANSPFYRGRLASCQTPLNRLEDFSRVPFTDAADLRQAGMQMLCVSQSEIARVVSLDTSGTSGTPKRCYFTLSDQQLTIDFFSTGMAVLVSPADRVLILLPGKTPGSVGDLLRIALENSGVTAIPHGPVTHLSDTLQTMREQRVTCLVASPTQALALALEDPGPIQTIRSVLLTTDHVPAPLANTIRDTWGCAVHNHYGMTEMGLGGGVSCEAQTGYHLREADLFFEIIDPVDGHPLPDGEAGEIVFTTLTRTGMPFIRYRTGDLGRFLTGACPCGTVLKTLSWVRTRVEGLVPLGGGVLCQADLDDAIFSIPQVYNFTARFTNSPQGPRLTLTVYTRPGSEVDEAAVLIAVRNIPVLRPAGNQEPVPVNIAIETGLPPDFGNLRKRKINTGE